MIITVKEGKALKKGDNEWVELTGENDKKHRVFKSIQKDDGTYCHLDKEVDMLKAKIDDGTISGLSLELTKEKKGTFWNVIGVEEVKNVFVKQAQEKLTTEKRSYGRDEDRVDERTFVMEVGADWRAGKRNDKDVLVGIREQRLRIYAHAEREVKNDKTKEKATKTDNKETVWTVKDYVDALRNQDYKTWWKDWAVQNKVDNKPTLEKTLEAMNIEQLYELKKKLKGG